MMTKTVDQNCQLCGRPLPATNELPVCDRCALEDALRLSDPAGGVPAPFDREASPGQNLLGRLGNYELVKVLGRGGMGTVYKARQAGSESWVAIKVLAGGVFADSAARERLKREAQTLARLRHPGIVKILEVGEMEGLPFLVMEFVDGPDLSELVRGHPLEPGRAAALVAEAAESIQSAHELGILHRDLKPANILLGPDNRPLVTDFGLAIADWMSPDLTRSGQILGSPDYSSPEQISAHRGALSPSSDIYSLGAVLFHLLTGRPPFAAATPADLLQQVLHREALPPSRLNPAVPVSLDAICLRCLEKNPKNRFHTAASLAVALRRFVDQPQVFAPVKWLRHHWRQAYREHPARAGASLFLLVLGILGLALSANLYWRNHQLLGDLNQVRKAEAFERLLRGKEELKRSRLAYAHQITVAQRAWQAGDALASRRSLELTDPTQRRWEYAYLKGLLERHHLRLQGHGNPVTAVAFDPAGKMLASVGMDLILRLWSIPDGKLIHETLAHGKRPLALVCGENGQLFVTGGQDGFVKVWHGFPPRLGREFRLNEGSVTAVDIHSSRSIVVAGDDLGSFHAWDLASGTRLASQPSDPQELCAVAFTRDGRLLATGGRDGLIRLWAASDWQRVGTLEGHRGPLRALKFSPDGSILASGGDDQKICLWRMSDRALLFGLTGHKGAILGLAYARDGSLLASSGTDGTIRLWNPSKGVVERILYGHAGRVNHVAFSADGQWLASGGADQEVCLWRPHETSLMRPLDGATTAITRLDFSPDGRFLLGGFRKGVIRLWNIETGSLLRSVSAHQSRVSAVAISFDGRTAVTAGSDGRCLVWDMASGQELRSFAPGQGPIRGLALAADGERAASSHDAGGVRIWSLATAEIITEIPSEAPRINRVQFSPEGTLIYLAGMAAAEVEVWNSRTAKHLYTIPLPRGPQTDLALSPDGKFLAGGTTSGLVFVIETKSGQLVWLCNGHSSAASQIAWSADGERLASCSRDGSLRIWDGQLGYELLQIRGLFSEGFAVAWSRDGGKLAAAGRSGRVWLIDPRAP